MATWIAYQLHIEDMGTCVWVCVSVVCIILVSEEVAKTVAERHPLSLHFCLKNLRGNAYSLSRCGCAEHSKAEKRRVERIDNGGSHKGAGRRAGERATRSPGCQRKKRKGKEEGRLLEAGIRRTRKG